MSNQLKLTGRVKIILEEQTFPSGFSKRDFVITTPDDKYPQDICFSLLKEKGALLNGVSVGQDVEVTFDIGGREYDSRYFVNLNAWRVDVVGGVASEPGDEHGAPIDEDNLQF